MSYFTHYWTGETFNRERRSSGRMEHTAGNQFTARGVEPDDTVYVISYLNGALYVVGRLKVDQIVSQTRARAILGTSDLWEAREHVIGKKRGSSNTRFDAAVDDADVARILFITADGSLASPHRTRLGHVDPQTFRGVREITSTTAFLLDKYL